MATKSKPYCVNLDVDQWHERDRVGITVSTKAGREVASFWDDEVHQLAEDGFFKPTRRPFPRYSDPLVDPQSVIDYLAHTGRCRRGVAKSLHGAGRSVRRRRYVEQLPPGPIPQHEQLPPGARRRRFRHL
jgi:hypothetical protein